MESMKKWISKMTLGGVLPTAAMVLLMGGTAQAFYSPPAEHENIILKDADGVNITSMDSGDNAFSMKETCGTCHGDKATYPQLLSYDEIERHSYHAQLAANDHYGYNPMNPDGDKWESGPSPKGKAWVQGQGHLGAW